MKSNLSVCASNSLDAILPFIEVHARRADESRQFPVESVRLLRETGLLGVIVPSIWGGIGGTIADVVEITQRLGGACLSTAIIFAMHCQQVAALTNSESTDLKERILPTVASGECYIASVTTEESGSSLFAADQPLTTSPKEEIVVIQRSAPIVTGGAHADGFLLKMRSSGSFHPNAIAWCYAAREQLDINVGHKLHGLGMRGVENVSMELTGQVPVDQIVAEGDAAHRLSAEVLAPMAHLGWSAAWLGAAHNVFRRLVQSVRRGQLPRVSIESELVRHRLARLRLRLESASSYLYGVLSEVEACNGREGSVADTAVQIHLNVLKVHVAEQTYAAANEMIELVGLQSGYCDVSDVPFERLLRDLRSASLNYDNAKLLSTIGSQCILDSSTVLLGS